MARFPQDLKPLLVSLAPSPRSWVARDSRLIALKPMLRMTSGRGLGFLIPQESCAICGFRQRKQSRNISENKGVNNAIIVPSMNSDGVRSVRPASISLQIMPIHGARRRGFSMAKRRSDEISAVAQSRTGLREPMKGEPRASGHGRSRNVIENKASCKNVMRVPIMNQGSGQTGAGARIEVGGNILGQSWNLIQNRSLSELEDQPINELEPAPDLGSWHGWLLNSSN
jgi:hypothetical protein